MQKHLIYHCTPLGNWRWNLEQLTRRLHIFDGVKLIAVAQGEGLEDLYSIRDEFPEGVSILPVSNDVELRETASLQTLLQNLSQLLPFVKPSVKDPFGQNTELPDLGICFYGHTKGVTRIGANPKTFNPLKQEAVQLWTEACYHHCLDRVTDVESMFAGGVAPMVGVFKRYGRIPAFPPGVHWHYSGTFYWFRVNSFFGNCGQLRIQVHQSRYGAEAYPAMVFPGVFDGACVFGDGIGDMYNLQYVKKILRIPDGTPPNSPTSRIKEKMRKAELRGK